LHTNAGGRVREVAFTGDNLSVTLMDGRTISVPLAWYPRLLHATKKQRDNWRIIGGGFGIHWPDVDEDISIDGLLRGAPARREKAIKSKLDPSKSRWTRWNNEYTN